jgi:hypothetical protein
MNYKIKISGSGTRKEITAALEQLIEDIETTSKKQLGIGCTWEDPILCTEISEE